MNKKSLDSLPPPKKGDRIALFVDEFNPPTNDHRLAIENLLLRPDISRLWICPIKKNYPRQTESKHICNMSSIFSAEVSSYLGKIVTCCTVGLDFTKPEDLLEWARSSYSNINFSLAGIGIDSKDKEPIFNVRFSNSPYPRTGIISVSLDKYVAVGDLKKRIIDGSDESRNITQNVWMYIQKERIFRK